MIKHLAIYLLLTSQFFVGLRHEYYVSLTEITYKPEQQRIEVISRLFHDDFENVLKVRYTDNVDLKPSKQSENIDNLIELYFEKKLTLSQGEQDYELEYLGYKFDDDRINIFMKIENVENLSNLRIQNLLLTDVIEEQKNIVHCFKPNQKKSVLLTRFDSEALLKFNE
jgi:hypothetical protein